MVRLNEHQRFQARTGPKDPETGCQNWIGDVDKDGYGRFRPDDGSRPPAHRFLWTKWHQQALEPYQHVRHRCLNRRCVNIDHLFLHDNRGRPKPPPKPPALPQTHCQRGHRFDERNTYWTAQGRRRCRACQAQKAREKRNTQ